MSVFFTLFYTFLVLLLSKNIVHFFQLDSYQFPSFSRTLLRNWKYSVFPYIILWGIELFFLAFAEQDQESFSLQLLKLVLLLLVTLLLKKKFAIKQAKKPLNFTSRVKRLWVSYAIFLFLGNFWQVSKNIPGVFLLSIPIFFLAALLIWPVEKMISEFYFRDARRKLNSLSNLTKIGITGSYGKTSVKNILGHILGAFTPTLISPKSFNTPMGLTLTIRNYLSPDYRVFVAEMGSRHLGDINELCRLVHPKIGIISSVGPQHLDTFKSLENIRKGKYELIQNLPKDGHAFFQDDQSIVKGMYEETKIDKTLVSMYDSSANVYVSNVEVNASGSCFQLCFHQNKTIKCTTVLLGEHNIKNIALAAAVAVFLGMPINLIAKSIASIEPIKNRMEIIKAGKYTIINDAFNSNPVGSKEAVSVLSKFPGRKIIITPGMVELGKDEESINHDFGVHIGKHVDIAILIGRKHVEPIKKGILSTGFQNDNLYIVSSLEESTRLLNSIVSEGDIVLYENDLPDNYIDA